MVTPLGFTKQILILNFNLLAKIPTLPVGTLTISMLEPKRQDIELPCHFVALLLIFERGLSLPNFENALCAILNWH